MEVETSGDKTAASTVDEKHVTEFINIINHHRILSLLVKTITNDDENSYQETDRIEHVYKSVKMIRNESLSAYLQVVENFYLNKDSSGADQMLFEHFSELLSLLVKKPGQDLDFFEQTEDSSKNESNFELLELIYDLFIYLNNSKNFSLSLENVKEILSLLKTILFKFKVSIVELCVRFSRIVGLIGIRLRGSNIEVARSIVKVTHPIT